MCCASKSALEIVNYLTRTTPVKPHLEWALAVLLFLITEVWGFEGVWSPGNSGVGLPAATPNTEVTFSFVRLLL